MKVSLDAIRDPRSVVVTYEEHGDDEDATRSVRDSMVTNFHDLHKIVISHSNLATN
jgi:hypothetical protein